MDLKKKLQSLVKTKVGLLLLLYFLFHICHLFINLPTLQIHARILPCKALASQATMYSYNLLTTS